MAELSTDDVEQFTGGRLSADDDETQRLLDAALAEARRYVGWHVSPPISDDTIVLDGPGGRLLWLPTQKLNTLTSVTEDGTELDITTLTWSGESGQQVRVRKTSHRQWTCQYQGIEVVMDHGYTEVEAASWRQAVLLMVDQMATGGRSDAALITKKVDDVQYQWADVSADQALTSVVAILDGYAVGQVAFA